MEAIIQRCSHAWKHVGGVECGVVLILTPSCIFWKTLCDMIYKHKDDKVKEKRTSIEEYPPHGSGNKKIREKEKNTNADRHIVMENPCNPLYYTQGVNANMCPADVATQIKSHISKQCELWDEHVFHRVAAMHSALSLNADNSMLELPHALVLTLFNAYQKDGVKGMDMDGPGLYPLPLPRAIAILRNASREMEHLPNI